MDRDYSYWRRALEGRALPCAVVDLDAFDANAAAILERAGDLPIRVASKSLRCEALLRRLQASSPRFQGLMCFTAPEALWLSARGFDNLLVAYPTTTPAHIDQVCKQVAAGKNIMLTVDSEAHLQQIAPIAAANGAVMPVSVEIDMSLRLPGLNFGVWRSPVRTPSQLLQLANSIHGDLNLRLSGIMGYEAQLAGVPDDAPASRVQNVLVRLLKRLSERVISKRRAAMLAQLDAHPEPDFINTGGTGSLEFSVSEPGVTEVTAGSGFYCSHLFDGYRGFSHAPAAFFALPVARIPAPGMVTCLGGGYPASGAAGKDRLPIPWLPEGARLSPLEGTGEVQTPLFYSGADSLALGDPVLFRHAKAGELCERFNTLLLVSNGKVVDEVTTYRGEGQCFL